MSNKLFTVPASCAFLSAFYSGHNYVLINKITKKNVQIFCILHYFNNTLVANLHMQTRYNYESINVIMNP